MSVSAAPLGDDPEPDDAFPRATTLRTTDPFEAWSRTQEFLRSSHRLTVLEREPAFLANVSHLSVGGIGLLRSSYGAPVRIECSPPIELITVNFVSGGELVIAEGDGRKVVDGRQAAVFCFHDNVEMTWAPGLRQLMVTIEKSLVERYLRQLLPGSIREPVRFESIVDLAGAGQGIAGAVRAIRRALTLCGKAGPPSLLAAELERALIASLLLGHGHNYTEAIFSAPALPAPRIVRQVVELIDSSAATALSVADLASFAGVSERSLHAAFQRRLGTSPMAYLRRRRLEKAHDELLACDPASGATVTEVALRHGFAHGGRFAAAYRARFGELPSATLHR